MNNESGYVSGLVGRPVGKVNITNSSVKNTTITAFYATRRKDTSIDEIVGDRLKEGVTTVFVDATTVSNSTGNTVTRTKIE